MFKKNLIIALVIIFSCFITPSAFARRADRLKSCYSNQRVILGAIEMYNMDSSIMMEELNSHNMQLLIDGKYLKEKPTSYDNHCEYASQGNLTEDGEIYCKYHGSITYNEEKKTGIPPSREYLAEQRRNNFRKRMSDFLPIFIGIGIIAFIVVSSPSNKKRAS